MSKVIDTGITENDLAAALLADAGVDARLPDDVDHWQMARIDPLHRSEKWWKNFLDSKAEAGELVCLRVWGGKRTVTIYRKAK
jgi:hypothetical protein